MSAGRMPCSISDGPDYDDWLEGPPPEPDEDEVFERYRQQEIDEAAEAARLAGSTGVVIPGG